jgi:S1-C subfamily serine protease
LGSLLVRETIDGEETNANMFVPIDLLKPILHDLLTRGRADRQSRPWLGVYAVELTGRIYVTGVADGSPAQVADIREGDLISQVGDREVTTLSEFYRYLWSLGPAGIGVPLTTIRGGTNLHLNVRSVDRTDLLKRPQAH